MAFDYKKKFKNRATLIAYFISVLTKKPLQECFTEAHKHKNKPFVLRYSVDS